MRTPILAVAAMLFALPAQADDNCHLYRATTVAMGIDTDGGVYVPMEIEGHSVNLLVDTGGILSMLTPESVKALGLPSKMMPFASIMMFGGLRIDHYVVAYNIEFGGLKAHDLKFFVAPQQFSEPMIGGTLAPDILSAYDVDFDFANNKFSLFLKDHCLGKVVYWTNGAFAAIPIQLDTRLGHINLTVQLDGKDVPATLDTGSSRSIMSYETAKNLFNIDDKDPKLKRTSGDVGVAHSYSYPFKTMTFGGVTVYNPDIVLVPDNESKMNFGQPRIILGMGILRQLHLYIAYGERYLYVTPASQY